MKDLEKKIFEINNEKDFEDVALEIFNFQARKCRIYSQYIHLINKKIDKITSLQQIPFLPIEFFKYHTVISFDKNLLNEQTLLFQSSGTTQMKRSNHYIYKPSLYEKSFLSTFENFFGNIEQYTILALLPSYIEAGNSSLVYMVDYLIKKTNNDESDFYLNNYEQLTQKLQYLDSQNCKTILFGVSYALLEMEKYAKFKLNNTIIIETGGMKGRMKEIIRSELHKKLKEIYGTDKIVSEYGMTELLSQAYCFENELFEPAQTMKVFIRDIYDPFSYVNDGQNGAINIIDLANLYSCSFIETKDLGRKKGNKFEVLGRMDNSDIRGCNLLVS